MMFEFGDLYLQRFESRADIAMGLEVSLGFGFDFLHLREVAARHALVDRHSVQRNFRCLCLICHFRSP